MHVAVLLAARIVRTYRLGHSSTRSAFVVVDRYPPAPQRLLRTQLARKPGDSQTPVRRSGPSAVSHTPSESHLAVHRAVG